MFPVSLTLALALLSPAAPSLGRTDILEMRKSSIPAEWGRLASARRAPELERQGAVVGLEMWFDGADALRYVQYIEDRHGTGVYQVHAFPRSAE